MNGRTQHTHRFFRLWKNYYSSTVDTDELKTRKEITEKRKVLTKTIEQIMT